MAEAPEYPYEPEDPESLKEEALLCVDQALLLEETNNADQALIMYQKALQKLDLALSKYESMDDGVPRKKQRLRLNNIRQQVLFRLQEHKNSSEKKKDSTSQPLISCDNEMPSDAEILFHIPREVQIFYISVTGEVSCPSYPSSLTIFRFQGFDTQQPAFLKVGSWVYPLVPGKSPVLKSRVGSYLFPDLDSSIEGNAIGIIFPKDLPLDELQVFEVILDQLTAVAQRDQDLQSYDEYKQMSESLSSGIVQGAEFVGLGLVAASVKASELVFKGSEKLKENIQPGGEDLKVDPRVKTGLEVARWTASKAAQGTGFLASKASAATLALGRFLAPHIREKGAQALSHLVEQSEEKSQKQIEIAGEVLGGTVRAFSAIYLSLESSGKILLQNVSNSTVNVVSHRYGDEVGTATENAFSTAGNAYLTVYNAAALGPKGLAKRAARNTAKAVVLPEEESTLENGANPNTDGTLARK